MTFPAKILLLILALPLIFLLFCLFLPLLILLIILGIFSPALRTSCRSFSTKIPGMRQENPDTVRNRKDDTEVCDVECTVLHAETVDQGSPSEHGPLQ